MKTSPLTYLMRNDGRLEIEFNADGFCEHGRLPGMVDLAEYLDMLQLHEKGILGEDGHRVPVTVLALGWRPASIDTVEYIMKTPVDGPFHAAWTADDETLEFVVAATGIEGMRALRGLYKAAHEGRAFAESARRGFRGGLRLVAREDASVPGNASASPD